MSNEYLELLKIWCDRLISLQITEHQEPELYGGILCPACAGVHGRCADAIYPMMTLYRQTGDEKYRSCAKALFDWMDVNMSRPDGSFVNDTNSPWRAITVFTTIQLGEALLYHGELLDPPTRRKWTARLDRAAAFIAWYIPVSGANVNYPITCSAALAIAAKVTGKAAYQQQAYEMAHQALGYITEDGLIYGEGRPPEQVTEKGCRPVDLGYNVEESLPGLVTYALVSGDDSVLDEVKRSMMAHLSFMLPDGGWDNSWGNRNNKWTYWGSRTSDGCQIGYGRLAREMPVFGEAAQRNFELYRRCTRDGLLQGGPMYGDAMEPSCVHHTFCHAKALASMVDEGFRPPMPRLPLPRETAQGVRFFPTARVWLLAKGEYRMTLSDHDVDYVTCGHAKGGALTLLWHPRTGPVCAASMTEYQLVEPTNMQLPQYYEDICQTPRITFTENGTVYQSINDVSAEVQVTDGSIITAEAKGILRDGHQGGDRPFRVRYALSEEGLELILAAAAPGAVFTLPVIAAREDAVSVSGGEVSVQRKGGCIRVEADAPIRINDQVPGRTFNPVGGFQTVQLEIPLEQAETCVVLRIN